MKRELNIAIALGLVLILSLTSAAQVSAVKAPITVVVSNPLAWQLSDYTVTFENGSLLVGPVDYIDLMFPTGTNVTTVTAVTVSKGPASTGPFAGVATTYNTFGAQTVRIRLDAAEFIEHSAWVLIVVADVTNPAPGYYSLCVGSSNACVVCSGSDESSVVTTHTLTMSTDPADSGAATDVTNESPYAAGTVVNIKAEAAAGYRFVKWTAPAGVFGDANAVETTFTMPGEAATITAWFELIPPLTYNLTMVADPALGGTSTDETGTPPYEAGDIVAIKAVAASGYRFVNWTATPEVMFGNATIAGTTITMPGEDVTVTAGFVAVYDLTVSSTTGGSVTAPGEGTFTYDAGSVVILVAEPEDGYRFVGWSGGLAAIADAEDPSTNIIMNGDLSAIAGFEKVEEPLGSGGCFIATAAYGTPMAAEIQVLREFRDGYLLTNPPGEAFVALYYRFSPSVARLIEAHPALKPVVRAGLAPVVATSGMVVNTYPVEKAALAAFLLLVSAAVALWATRRRGVRFACPSS